MVADAEAIKTLLKLPYLSEPISMIVHRVGNTVLIDDFDLERLFCRYRVCRCIAFINVVFKSMLLRRIIFVQTQENPKITKKIVA